MKHSKRGTTPLSALAIRVVRPWDEQGDAGEVVSCGWPVGQTFRESQRKTSRGAWKSLTTVLPLLTA